MNQLTYDTRRRASDKLAIGVIKILSMVAIAVLVIILGYIIYKGLVSDKLYESDVIPGMSSESLPLQAVVNTGSGFSSIAYPVLKDFYGGKTFSLRKTTSVDSDATLFIESGMEHAVMEYLELDEQDLARSRVVIAPRREVYDRASRLTGAIALVSPGVPEPDERRLEAVPIEDMVLAVHPSVTELVGNIRLSSLSEEQVWGLLAGEFSSWRELNGQDLPVVPVSDADDLPSTPGAVVAMPFREANAAGYPTLSITARIRSRNLEFAYLVEPPVESGKYGGISTIIGNTLLMVLITIAIAAPLGIGAAVFMVEYRQNKRLLGIVKTGVDLLAGVPSIIFGLFGLLVFVQLAGWSFSLLSGSLTIAIMILPTIIRTSEEAIRSVESGLREASVALGATKWETIWRVVIPSAAPGITTGIILAIGRAVGETAALIYTIGSSTDFATNPMESARVLAMHIFLTITEGQSLDRAFASALVLVVLVLIINTLARLSARRFLRHGAH